MIVTSLEFTNKLLLHNVIHSVCLRPQNAVCESRDDVTSIVECNNEAANGKLIFINIFIAFVLCRKQFNCYQWGKKAVSDVLKLCLKFTFDLLIMIMYSTLLTQWSWVVRWFIIVASTGPCFYFSHALVTLNCLVVYSNRPGGSFVYTYCCVNAHAHKLAHKHTVHIHTHPSLTLSSFSLSPTNWYMIFLCMHTDRVTDTSEH